MNKTKAVVAAIGLVVAASANAEWYASIEDDIFSGGKKAIVLGDVGPGHSLAFDCAEGELTAALLEEGAWSETDSPLSAVLLIKVDDNAPIQFDARYGERNAKYKQIISLDRDTTLKALKEIQAAQHKILVGVKFVAIDSKWSGTAPVTGSTREVGRFLEACKLN